MPLGAIFRKDKKNWRHSTRQFSHIVGNAYQTPLGFDLLQPPQVEPAEAHIVFDVAEDGFDFDIALDSEQLALLGK